MNPTHFASQIEQDFPGIWARIEKKQTAVSNQGKLPIFPIVQESATRIYPKGTIHPSGYSLRYLMSSGSDPEIAKEFREVIARGVDEDSVFVAYSEETLQGVAAWRTTKLHYAFDPDFYDALAATPMKGTPPSQIFERLPAKAFFISRKGGIQVDGDETLCYGYFVVILNDQLLMMPMTNNSVSSGRFTLRMNKDTVECALDRICEEGLDSSIRVIQGHPNGTAAEKLVAIEKIRSNWPVHEQRLRETWGGALSCLLYLCTEEPDVDSKQIPSSKIIRMGGRVRYSPAKFETQISVGIRFGSIFRKHLDSNSISAANSSAGKVVMPHIRRAHWHTYWIGKKSDQKPELKWLSPILINTTSTDKLTETIHSIQQ